MVNICLFYGWLVLWFGWAGGRCEFGVSLCYEFGFLVFDCGRCELVVTFVSLL